MVVTWGRCERCGGYASLPHGCRPFRAWMGAGERPGLSGPPTTIWGRDAEEAAEAWACEANEGNDYWMMGGIHAYVVLEDEHGVRSELVVRAEAVIEYSVERA